MRPHFNHHMKPKLVVLSLVTLLAVASVFGLYWYEEATAVRQYDFPRQISGTGMQAHAADLGLAGYYIAGIAANEIWLGNARRPRHLLRVRDSAVDTLKLELPDSISQTEIRVDSPDISVSDVGRYDVYSCSLEALTVNDKLINNTFFSEAVPVSRGSVVLRSLDRKENVYVLEKKSRTPSLDQVSNMLLQKQVDGLFCVDGKLSYDRNLNALVYVYFYRNEFFVADTSLNLLWRAHTIDPIDKAQIEVREVKSAGGLKFSKPPLVVNKQSCVAGSYLFVQSALASQHEDLAVFDKASVFDVYNLAAKGAYVKSFYIPDYRDKKVNRFAAVRDKLVAVHGTHLVMYSIDSLLISSGP